MQAIGNLQFNRVAEATLATSGVLKPSSQATMAEKKDFILLKYVQLKFVPEGITTLPGMPMDSLFPLFIRLTFPNFSYNSDCRSVPSADEVVERTVGAARRRQRHRR
jgi:hypothetical protein